MRSARSFVLGLLVVLLPALAGHAQVTNWNRQLTHILLDETTSPDFYDIRVRFDVLAADAPSSTQSNVGTEVEVRVNSVVVEVENDIVPITVDNVTPGSCVPALCGGTCGGGSFAGTSNVMSCRADGSSGCECASPQLEFTLPMVELRPEDYIEVLLRPSPGALPDSDNSDDTGALRFGSWNRKLESIDVEPDPAGPGSIVRANFSVQLFDDTAKPNTVPLPADTQIFFEQNGTPIGDEIMVLLMPAAPGPTPLCAPATCGVLLCAQAEVDGMLEDMFCDAGECDCRLQSLSLEITTPDPVPPTDSLDVALKPGPGALPELPGFDDDDLMRQPVPALSRPALLGLGIGLLGVIALGARARWR